MKAISFLIILLLSNALSYGQSKCQTFQEFKMNGNSIQELDSLYTSGLNIDTNIAVL